MTLKSSQSTQSVGKEQWATLSEIAWKARDNAYIIGNTRVGAALLTDKGTVFAGCNVEHRYRCHDVHAEVNAITSMITSGETGLIAIIITAERDFFTPCGGCLDWIFQFGGAVCQVACQGQREGDITIFQASELMPHYPR